MGLLAAHISDGVLAAWPQAAGWLVAALSLAIAFRSLDERELPRVSLLAAVFFIGSMVHLKAGPTSVHPLLNGLLGLLLGYRAVIPIALALLMQAVLLGHGGFFVLGLNICLFAWPALLARPIYRWFDRRPSVPGPVALPFALAGGFALWPGFVFPIWLGGQFAALHGSGIPRRTRAAFAVGFLCVIMTMAGNFLALTLAGTADWTVIAWFTFICHLPIALLEGFLTAAVVAAVVRAKPEMLANIRPGGA